MSDLTVALIWAGTTLAGIFMLCIAALKAWRGWLDLRREEIERSLMNTGDRAPGQRIELADVRERLRKLEAIARGVDP